MAPHYQALAEPPKTLDQLMHTDRGWSPRGARAFVATMSILIGASVITSICLFCLATDDGSPKLMSLLPLLSGLPLVGCLVAAVYNKQHPLGEALRSNYVNPEYPPEEVSFKLRYDLLWVFGPLVGIFSALGAIGLGIWYCFSPHTWDNAVFAFTLGLGLFGVCLASVLLIRVKNRLIHAEWERYVAVRDAKSPP